MQSKVLILTEGGRNIGFGHITRCVSLYRMFEEKGMLPELMVNGDASILEFLKDKKFQIFNWIQERQKLFETMANIEIAIIDSHLADISFYKDVSRLVKIPLYIDDIKRLDYPKGIVINGSICAEEINYPEKEGTTYLLGSKYAILRKEFWNIPKKEIKNDIENLLVTFGGADGKNITPRILKFLNEKYPKFTKDIIIGGSFRNIKEIEYLNIHSVHYDDNVPVLISEEPVYPQGDDLKELRWEIDMMQEALKNPILEYKDFEKGGKYYG